MRSKLGHVSQINLQRTCFCLLSVVDVCISAACGSKEGKHVAEYTLR